MHSHTDYKQPVKQKVHIELKLSPYLLCIYTEKKTQLYLQHMYLAS